MDPFFGVVLLSAQLQPIAEKVFCTKTEKVGLYRT
jgi:hypothetical protein